MIGKSGTTIDITAIDVLRLINNKINLEMQADSLLTTTEAGFRVILQDPNQKVKKSVHLDFQLQHRIKPAMVVISTMVDK